MARAVLMAELNAGVKVHHADVPRAGVAVTLPNAAVHRGGMEAGINAITEIVETTAYCVIPIAIIGTSVTVAAIATGKQSDLVHGTDHELAS